MSVYVIELCRNADAANRILFEEVIAPRLEEAASELRGFRLLPLVFVLLVERAVDHAIGLVLGLGLGGEDGS
jgi:hypothetical protein